MKPDDPTRPPTDPPDDDDDLALGPLPAPEAEAEAGERARARGFADLVDKMMAGRTPAVVPTEDQALLEVATAIRATVRPPELAAARRRSIVEGALATAIDRKAGGTVSVPRMPRVTGAPAAGAGASGSPGTIASVSSLEAARTRRGARALPWIVAAATSAVAAAAIVLLVVERRAPAPRDPAPAVAVRAELPVEQRSRPADPLVGIIAADAAGAAADRIDTIYADRLGGFRDRAFARGSRLGGTP